LLEEVERKGEGAVDVGPRLTGRSDEVVHHHRYAGLVGFACDAGDLAEVELLLNDFVDDTLDAAFGADTERRDAALQSGELPRLDVIGAKAVRDLEREIMCFGEVEHRIEMALADVGELVEEVHPAGSARGQRSEERIEPRAAVASLNLRADQLTALAGA